MINFKKAAQVFLPLLIVCIYLRLYLSAKQSRIVEKKEIENERRRYKISTHEIIVTTTTRATPQQVSDLIPGRFERRLMNVKQQCAFLEPNYIKKWEEIKIYGAHNSSLIADSESQSILCLVLKAGSSSWNDFFWKIRQPDEYKRFQFWEKAVHGNRNAFHKMYSEEIKEIWNNPNSSRILSVRHPFARLISGFHDKFAKLYYYAILFKKYPNMKKYPNKYGNWTSRSGGHFMEWEDFARYVADYGKDYRKNLDGHFHPVTSTCDPCTYPFNYIVKLETFDEDVRWLIEKRFSNSSYEVRKLNLLNKKSTKETIKEYFSKLKSETAKKIYEVYAKDMILFGYSFNFTSLEAGGWND